MKRIFALLCAFSVILPLFMSCEDEQPVETALLELDRANMKMITGQSQQLYAVLKGSDDELVWSSDKPAIVEVDQDGLVTAVSAGNAVVTVAAGSLSRTCKVEVQEFRADRLLLNDEISDGLLVLAAGEEFQIEPRFYKAGEKVNDMAYPVFSLDNAVPARVGETVASVDSEGLIKATAPGTIDVTVSGAGISATFNLTVKELSLDKTVLSLYLQETASIEAVLLPSGLSDSEKTIEWYSSDKESVSVDSEGNVKGLKVTSEPVEIMAKSNGVTAVCKVSVYEFMAHSVEFVDLGTSLRENDGAYEMYVGDVPVALTALFKDSQGADVCDKVIDQMFTSSDASVASVTPEGVLGAVGPGNVTITVSGAGVENSFSLSVIQGVESLTTTPSDLKTVYEGSEPFTITARVLPENATVKAVTYVSDNASVASVDPSTGLVTIGNQGVAKITVSTKGFKRPVKGEDGTYLYEPVTSTLIINVIRKDMDNEGSISISAEGIKDGTLMIQKGATVQLTATVESSDLSGTYSWMVTDDIISVDEDGRLTALAVGTSAVVVMMTADNGQSIIGELPVKVTGVNPTSIKILNGDKLEAAVNETPVVLEAKATSPANADFAGVNWYSSNEKIVVVDKNGQLTYTGVGEAVVVAKSKTWDGSEELADVRDEIAVKILNTDVTDFDIICAEGGIYHGGIQYLEENASLQLECVTIPRGALPNTVVWRSAMTETATVSSDGTVYGVKASSDTGTDVVITCIVDGSIENTFTVRVVKVQPDDIVVTLPDRPLKIGESWNLDPKVIPESLGLYPSNSFRSPVDESGVFTSYEPGDIHFGFYVSDTHSPSIITTLQRSFTITVEPYWVTEITLPETYEMEAGSSSILIPSFKSDVDGKQPTYMDVIWTSSDPKIVRVDSRTGEVVAYKEGTALITATTSHDYSVPAGQSQKSASCLVTVKKPEIKLNVGDYYYSDGTWSSELDASKTVIGVVFAKINPTSSDSHLASDYPDCTRGLVVSTSEYVTPFAEDRDWGRSDLISWMNNNGFTNVEDTQKCCGYGNTKGFIAINQANVMSYGDVIRLDICDAVTQHRNNIKQPHVASDWYIPSYQEMKLLYDSLEEVNSSLTNAGGAVVNSTYNITYSRTDGKVMTATKGQQYYYSNVGHNQITSFDMSTANVVQPSLYRDGNAVSAVSYGEKTPLPVRFILAF